MKKNSKKKLKKDLKKTSEKKKKRSTNDTINEAVNDKKYDKIIKWQIISSIILLVIFGVALAINIILVKFKVKNVTVEGNKHYSSAQIEAMVMKGKFGDNSLYLSLKYSDKSITDIPFIQSMDVDVIDRNSIKITVYEKKLAGYVEYLGKYMYFDKDGVVVETSNIRTAGVPLVSGLSFDHFVMDKPLPVENEAVFKTILNVTRMLNKYAIDTDKIYFDDKYNMTLYFGKIRVRMGDTALLEEKMQMLQSILPQIAGQKGLLDMTTYDEGSENITFTKDK